MESQKVFAADSTSNDKSAPEFGTVAKLNKEKLENLVYMKMQPHPIIIIMGVLITIMIVYGFWVVMLKSSPEGIWITNLENAKCEIICSKVFKTITIMEDDKVSQVGTLNGSVLTIGEGAEQRRGMWDTNKIYWITGPGKCSEWVRELTLI
jgi:hypothetical protein